MRITTTKGPPVKVGDEERRVEVGDGGTLRVDVGWSLRGKRCRRLERESRPVTVDGRPVSWAYKGK